MNDTLFAQGAGASMLADSVNHFLTDHYTLEQRRKLVVKPYIANVVLGGGLLARVGSPSATAALAAADDGGPRGSRSAIWSAHCATRGNNPWPRSAQAVAASN